MKKIFLLLTVFSMVFASCDPLEDIYEELDNGPSNAIVGEANITLTDDDYSSLGLTFTNFGSVAEAKTKIPSFLDKKYPVWGKNSGVKVTFKFYNKVNTYSKNVYALSDAEHNAITGKTYGNFDKTYHITNFINNKYTTPAEGDFVSLRYRFYAGGEKTLTDGFSYTGGKWNKITGFTAEEYKAMGENYPNFSSHDEAAAKIPVTLVELYKFNPKSAGDIVSAMYELYKGGGVTKSYTSNFIFNGTSFTKYNNVLEETIQFGHDGTKWVPDNTIKYTLDRGNGGDYDWLATVLTGAEYAGLIGNLANYNDFDYNWTNDQIVYSLGLLADHINPTAADGQKYIFTYIVYDNGEQERKTHMIKEAGAWKENK